MAYHQPCDTYFVEDASYPTHRPVHDMAQMLGRRRQQDQANELSRQASEAYLEDMIAHMRTMEDITLPDVASIDIQQEIQWFMRPYLIDFLIEAHAAFQLLPETLFLAVNLLDRYCSKRVVYKRHYQLVGCAALLIAAKYGDVKDRVPMIRELKSMCCSLYDEDMFTQMEWHVLNTLEWMIGHPTVDTWLQIAFTVREGAKQDTEVEHMSWYLCEIAMYHKDFVSRKPSVMARATVALARDILGRNGAYDHDDTEANEVILRLHSKLRGPSQVLFRKYAARSMDSVASTLERTLAAQEAMIRRNTPPTPPYETMQSKPVHMGQECYPGTPVKQPYGHAPHGMMTPPITPDGQYFLDGNGNGEKGYMVPRCPVTPTPTASGNHYLPMQQQLPQQQQQYQQWSHDVSMH